jgi:hypothetical protein
MATTPQDFTPVKLKDGTMIKLKGSNLNPQQVAAGVAKFRAAQPGLQKPPATQPPSQTAPQAPQQPSSSSNPVPPFQGPAAGFSSEHMWESAKQGLKNVVVGTVGYNPLIKGPGGEERGEGSIFETLANLDKHLPEMSDQSKEIHGQAREALKRGVKGGGTSDIAEGMTKALFAAIPGIGPWLNDKYNQAMSGDPGGALVEGATTAAAGKLLEHIQSKGAVSVEDLKNSFPKHAIVAAANDTLESSAKDFKQNVLKAVKNTNEVIGQKVKLIADADRTASPNGSFSKTDIAQTSLDAVNSVNAQHVDLPGTGMVQKAIARYGNTLTWEDVKDLRGVVDAARQGASGKDLAVLGRLQKIYSEAL